MNKRKIKAWYRQGGKEYLLAIAVVALFFLAYALAGNADYKLLTK